MARPAKSISLEAFKASILDANPITLAKLEVLIRQERERQANEVKKLMGSSEPLELSDDDLKEAEDAAPAVQ